MVHTVLSRKLRCSYLGLGFEQQRGVRLASKLGEAPLQERQRNALSACFGVIHLGQQIPSGTGGVEHLGPKRINCGYDNRRRSGDLGGGRQDGDNVVPRGVALSEGLHSGGDLGTGSDGGIAIRGWVVCVIVIGIRDLLRLNLDYSGRARAA